MYPLAFFFKVQNLCQILLELKYENTWLWEEANSEREGSF